jgi:hypothetical protein
MLKKTPASSDAEKPRPNNSIMNFFKKKFEDKQKEELKKFEKVS